MPIKSDNPNEVGQHIFERAGLGLAPFRFVGFHVCKYQACPGAPILPGTSCDYCGTGIMDVCEIRSADGKKFKVGSTCVDKTGDAGMIKAYKQSPEYREKQRKLTRARNEVKRLELQALLDSSAVQDSLKSRPHPSSYHAEKGKTQLDYCVWMFKNAGASGRNDILKFIKGLGIQTAL